jgi:hypothetical protein
MANDETFNLMRETPEKVRELYKKGLITAEQAASYAVQKNIEKRGWLKIEPRQAKLAHDLGILTDQQAVDYYQHKQSPFMYRVKDVIGRPIPHAVRDLLNEGLQTLQGVAKLYDDLNKKIVGAAGVDTTEWSGPSNLPQYEVKPIESFVAKPQTTTGQVVKSLEQFGAGYAIGLGGVKRAAAGAKWLEALARTHPKAHAFMQASMAGIVSDGVFYDPYEKRISNFIADSGDLGQLTLGWLAAEDEDGVIEAKLKAAAEGFFVGSAFEGAAKAFMGCAKLVKGKLWARKAGDPDKVAEEVLDKFGDLMEDSPQNMTLTERLAAGKELGILQPLFRVVDDVVEEAAEEGAEKATVKATAKRTADDFLTTNTGMRRVGPNYEIYRNLTESDLQQAAKDIFAISTGALDVDIKKGLHHNFDKISSPDDVLKMINYTSELIQRRGDNLAGDVLTDVEAREIAAELGVDLRGMRKVFGEMMNKPFEVRAYRAFMQNFAEYTFENLTKNADTPEGQARFLQAFSLLYEMQRLVKGMSASAGRTLRAFQEVIEGSEGVYPQITKEQLEALVKADAAGIKKVMAKAAKIKTTSLRLLYARQAGKLRSFEALLELSQAGLVSGIPTQLVNVVSNLATLAYETFIHQASIGMYGWVKNEPEMYRRAFAWWHGAHLGLADAVRLPKVFSTKLTPEDLAKIADPGTIDKVKLWIDKVVKEDPECGTVWRALWTGKPVTDTLDKVDERGALPEAFKGIPIGTLIKLPFRLLTAADELFKSVVYRSSLYSEAFNEGWQMGLKGKELGDFVETAATSINYMRKTGALGTLSPQAYGAHARAIDQARINTFTQPLGVSETSTFFKRVGDVLSGIPIMPSAGNDSRFGLYMSALPSAIGLLVRITAVPFYKILVNITRYTLQNTPLGLASKRFRDDFFSTDPIRKISAVNRIMLGTATIFGGAALYNAGYITGHIPQNQRDAANNVGILPYGVHVGDKWIGYDRLDWFGSLLGIGANLSVAHELLEKAGNDPENTEMFDDYLAKSLMVLSDTIVNKTWAQGVLELLNAVSNPERFGWKKWALGRAQAMLPYGSALKNIQKASDPLLRELVEWEDVLWSVLDSSKMIPKRHPVYQTPMDAEPRALGLFRMKEQSKDPVLIELARVGANVEPLKRKQSFNGLKVELSKEEFDELGQINESLAGQLREALLRQMEGLKQGTDDTFKAAEYLKTISQFRSIALGLFFERHQDVLVEKLKSKIDLQAAGLKGLEHLTNPKQVDLTKQLTK